MRIRALSVFEGVIYHCTVVDRSSPCRPTLEVEAVLRPGDADQGPLLLSLNEYVLMAGGPAVARRCLASLAARGRIVRHLDVDHVAFPTWTPIDTSPPAPYPPAGATHPDEAAVID